MSSSAAVEVAVAFALLSESGHAVDRSELAKLCQKAENEFVGARVGIMDQFISCYGRASHALLLDCRTLQHKFVKRILRTTFPEIRALRDVTLSQLEAHRRILPPKVFARCRHVITENERVKSAVEAFHRGDTAALGPLLLESHRSLRAGYEVSCRELDLMVEVATAQPGLIGARMTGGGLQTTSFGSRLNPALPLPNSRNPSPVRQGQFPSISAIHLKEGTRHVHGEHRSLSSTD